MAHIVFFCLNLLQRGFVVPNSSVFMARKTVSGPIRDKERTKAKLLKTVGKIIMKHGFHQLTVSRIAAEAGVDRKLIYEYFGSVDNLINAYLRARDFGSKMQKLDLADATDHGKEISKELIKNMFAVLTADKELQKIIVWEVSAYHKILRELADRREELGEEMMQHIMKPHFKENLDKYRAVLAILISSTYYLNLHRDSNGSLFCGLDIRTDKDKNMLEEVVNDIIDFAYEKYGL